MTTSLPRTVALALSGAIGSAAAADWHYTAAPGDGEPLKPASVVATRDGYAVLGADVVHQEWWLQVRDDGSVASRAVTDRLELPQQANARDEFATVADGALSLGPACTPTLYEDDGTVRWRGVHQTDGQMPCAYFGATTGRRDPERALWVAGGRYTDYRIFADGQRRALGTAGTLLEWQAFAPLSASIGAYGLYVDPRLGHAKGVARLTPDEIQWRHDAEQDALLHDVQEAANGDVLVGGSVLRNGFRRLLIERRAPDGTLRWQRIRELRANAVSLRVQAGDRFVVGLSSDSPEGDVVAGFGGDGTELWRVPLRDTRFAGFVRHPDGPPADAPASTAVLGGPPGSDGVDRVLLIDAEGRTVLTRRTLSTPAVKTLRDGTLVNIQPDRIYAGVVRRYAADGTERPAPDVRAVLPRQHLLRRSVLAADGASVLLEDEASAARARLSEIAPDGRLLWSAVLPGAAYGYDADALPIAVNAELACVGPLRSSSAGVAATLHCLRRADGSEAYVARLPRTHYVAVARNTLRFVAGGGLELVESNEAALIRTRIDPDGTVVGSEVIARLAGLPIAVDGGDGDPTFLLGTPDAGAQLATVSSGGVRIQPIAIDVRPLYVAGFRRLADGGALMFVDDPTYFGATTLHRLGADGVSRWDYRLLGAATPDRLDVVGNSVLVAHHQRFAAVAGEAAVTVLDLETGARRWEVSQHRLSSQRAAAVAIDGVRERALVLRQRGSQTVLTTYALADGAVLSIQPIACGDTQYCYPREMRVTADGAARITFERAERSAGYQVQVSNAEVRALQPVAQYGIAGTWLPRDSAGQGVVIEYAPSQRTIAGGWFTYVAYGVQAPDWQNWYSLQGNASIDARSAELTIHENRQGAFGRGAAAAPSSPGRATLRLLDCDQAVLSYHFDGDPGLKGDIPLVRATAPSFDCTDASGVRPAPGGTSTAPGVEVGQWGAWFDPAAPGEGVLFDLQPPTATDPGRLAGGWFTYDVETGGRTQTRWFTLQGDFANVRDGAVTVPLFRTFGGGFDQKPTRNTERVGEVTVRFDGCERATFDYRFDDSGVAGAFAGRSGTMALVKVTPCANEADYADAAARARPR